MMLSDETSIMIAIQLRKKLGQRLLAAGAIESGKHFSLPEIKMHWWPLFFYKFVNIL